MKPLKKIFTMILILMTLLFYSTKTSLAYDQMSASNEKITPIPPEIISTREEDMPLEKIKVRSWGKTMLLLLLLGGAGAGAAIALSNPEPDKGNTGTIGVSW